MPSRKKVGYPLILVQGKGDAVIGKVYRFYLFTFVIYGIIRSGTEKQDFPIVGTNKHVVFV